MQIHSNDMVTTSLSQHVGDKLSGDGSSGLVLLILSCIGEMRDDGCDSSGRGNLASMDHDTEFHQMSVHSPCTRIDNVYIAISHALHDSDFGLTRRWLADVGSRERYSQSLGDQSSKFWVRGTRKELDSGIRSRCHIAWLLSDEAGPWRWRDRRGIGERQFGYV